MGMRLTAALVLFGCAVLVSAGCERNMFTGNLTPVPPVHRLPVDVERPVVLIDKDPEIETKDPNHVQRAKDQGVPQGYRAAMESALGLAGFRVTRSASDPHDLVAKLAIAVSEDGDKVTQVYRCGIASPDGAAVAQIDWTWPRGIYVDVYEVFDFATHNVATEVSTSQRVLRFLRAREADAGRAEIR
jgi:hypothetical protein